tara:strand:+ start:55136 stop:56056 length:921 start_codon:yes stop_codon:yes gene_type:complete
MFKKNAKIFLAGHKGHLGSAIYKKLIKKGYKNIVTRDRNKLNLLNQRDTSIFLKKNKPNIVIIAAAKVGGILANNKYRADFIYENLQIQNNLIHSSYKAGIKNLVFLGSSCIYPKGINNKINEKMLLSGKLEYTNEPYAIAKIAGIKLCENYNIQYKTNYKCLMPCNSYGPNDNYHIENSHFFAALIKKIQLAKKNKKKSITLWGSGKPKRELIYVDDIADACIFFMNKKISDTLVNIGTGIDFSITQYAKFLMREFKVNLKIIYDKSKPDGIKRKLLDTSLAKRYGWVSKTSLKKGIKLTLENLN